MTGDKAGLRRLVRQQPRQVDSDALCRNLLAHPWFLAAKTVMAYVAIPPEPVLSPVLEAVLDQGKTLLLPRCGDGGTMTARIVEDLSQLRPGAFGIPEPGADMPVFPAERIDLILVPGLAFDIRGRRLGRGKGYYDRFLAGCTGRTMGICGFLAPEVPVEAHDRTMDAVVTDQTIILCEMEDDACLTTSGI